MEDQPKTLRVAIIEKLEKMKEVASKEHKNVDEVIGDLADLWANYTSLFFFLTAVTVLTTRGGGPEESLEMFIEAVRSRNEKTKIKGE